MGGGVSGWQNARFPCKHHLNTFKSIFGDAMVSSIAKVPSISTNPYLLIAPKPTALPVGLRIEIIGDLLEKPRGKRLDMVVEHVLDRHGIRFRDLKRPQWFGMPIEKIMPQEDFREYARQVVERASPQINADLMGLIKHPNTHNFSAHQITLDRWLGNDFYARFINQEILESLSDARAAYIDEVNGTRQQVLQKSLQYADAYRGITTKPPDIVGLFYFYQILTIGDMLIASHDTVGAVLPCLRQIFTAHELPVTPYLTSPNWYDAEGISTMRSGAFAMIGPLIETELVRHFQRAVRYNWSLIPERRSLLEFADEKHLIRSGRDTLDALFDAQPPGWIGRLLSFFRHLRTRTPPIRGSMDDFLMQNSLEMEALLLREPSLNGKHLPVVQQMIRDQSDQR